MGPDVLIAAVVAALVAGALGFFLGRRARRAADRARIEALGGELEDTRIRAEERERALEAELGDAKQRADTAQAGVAEHFDASAELLGQLAKDYRALFEHWADGAHRLGGSATRAEAIIEQARERLLVGASEDGAGEFAEDAQAQDEAQPREEVPAAPDAALQSAGPEPRREQDASGEDPEDDDRSHPYRSERPRD